MKYKIVQKKSKFGDHFQIVSSDYKSKKGEIEIETNIETFPEAKILQKKLETEHENFVRSSLKLKEKVALIRI